MNFHMNQNSKINNSLRSFTTLLFIIYLIITGWILLFKLGVHFNYMGKRHVNLVPFNEPSILNSENMLNVVIFVPIGIYTGMLFQSWTFSKKLPFIFFLSFLVEALQYIFRIGIFDVTDILTNTLGGLIGYLLFKVLEKLFNNPVGAYKFMNVIAAIGTALFILLLVLLKLNMLPIRYQ